MGWSNYIIIEDWKMMIETNRAVNELEDYIKQSLDKMIENDTDIDVCISDLKFSDITVKDLCILATVYENASSFAHMEIDKLFLYWLESKDIKYGIQSEFNVDIKQYIEKGYKIIRTWKSDNENGNDNTDNHKGDNQ